jgi:tRNA threonylcarbamoyladenosine biosynthesis protein TsaE
MSFPPNNYQSSTINIQLSMSLIPEKCTTSSPEETEALGVQTGERVEAGTVIALSGELGCGKTVFSRGLARGLGVDEPVTSPTFPIVQSYFGGRLTLHHIDVYRLGGSEEAVAFGIEEYLDDPDAVVVVEWAQRLEPLLEHYSCMHIQFMPDGPTVRHLTVSH